VQETQFPSYLIELVPRVEHVLVKVEVLCVWNNLCESTLGPQITDLHKLQGYFIVLLHVTPPLVGFLLAQHLDLLHALFVGVNVDVFLFDCFKPFLLLTAEHIIRPVLLNYSLLECNPTYLYLPMPYKRAALCVPAASSIVKLAPEVLHTIDHP